MTRDEPVDIETNDDGIDVEWTPEAAPFITDSLVAGQVFFYPDLPAFCEVRGLCAVQTREDGAILLYPSTGGKPILLENWGQTPLRSVPRAI